MDERWRADLGELIAVDTSAEMLAELDMWPVPRDRWFTLWWESK